MPRNKSNRAGRYDWDKLTRLIPGYDPWKTAGDCVFDQKLAEDKVGFIEDRLVHAEGSLQNQPVILEPWQIAVVGNLFGWLRPDGTRRYRILFLYVPRKNGKTLLGACILCVILFGDGEPGAQIYCLAADRDQASLCFKPLRHMIAHNPDLLQHVGIYESTRTITLPALGSYVRVISHEANTKHGFNTHAAVEDEIHAHKSADLVEVIDSSTSARKQPLIIKTTTADYDRPSLCNRTLERARKIRDGIFDNPYFLPVLYEAGKEDDWTDEKLWFRVNPNLGVSKSLEYMREKCREAKEDPSQENTFKRLELNIVTEQSERWLPMADWDACKQKLRRGYAIQPAMAGLDLAQTQDLTAFVILFRWPDGSYDIRPRIWCPQDVAKKLESKGQPEYMLWARKKLIELSPGDVTDYALVRRRIKEDVKKYRIVEVGYDPKEATQLAQQLQEEDGVTMVEVRQGYAHLNEPCKEFGRLLKAGRLRHGGHPVLRWMATNISLKRDTSGAVMPDKMNSAGKIDGLVATIIGLERHIRNPVKHSPYRKRGVRAFSRSTDV